MSDWIEFGHATIAIMGIYLYPAERGHVRHDILIGQLKGRHYGPPETFSVLLIFIPDDPRSSGS